VKSGRSPSRSDAKPSSRVPEDIHHRWWWFGERTSHRTTQVPTSQSPSWTGATWLRCSPSWWSLTSAFAGRCCRARGRCGQPAAGTGAGPRRGAACGRAAKPQARAAWSRSRAQRRAAPVNHCPPYGAKRVPLLRFRESLQLGGSSHCAGRRAARRRCALDPVQEVLTGRHADDCAVPLDA
jgi:hypothetical protein